MADVSEESTEGERQSRRNARKCAHVSKILMREEFKAQMKKVSDILKKCDTERTEEELMLLEQSPDLVKNIEKRKKLRQLTKHRLLEIEDSEEEMVAKCLQLAQAIRAAKYVVLYTGAGISTAASIPDYRGPSGVWTLLQQGIQPKVQDLSAAEPTYTHMAIKKLHQMGVVKHVVSQNCDGLHLRSGLPRHILSELHGNMFIEVCRVCNPPKEYLRLFDVTERTGVRRHQTGRMCSSCQQELRDSIVHFGERSPGLESPYNWEEAAQAADQADLILCIGSSLKVLKKYPCLWSNHKPASQKPSLYIVNLQWTPKDDGAVLKINGRCDEVLRRLLQHLGLTADAYNPCLDPLYCLATPLHTEEQHTTSKHVLTAPPHYNTAAVLSNIRHEQLRSLERNKRRSKKKGTGRGAGRDQAYSNFYEEKLVCGMEEEEEEEEEDGEGEVTEASVDASNPSSALVSDSHAHPSMLDQHREAGPLKCIKPASRSPQGPTSSRPQGPHMSTVQAPQLDIKNNASAILSSSKRGGQSVMASLPPQTSPPKPPSKPNKTEKAAASTTCLQSVKSQADAFIQLPPPMQSLPLGPFMPGNLLPFPMALPASSPDVSQERSLETLKFHQTLQMLQLQSQLHMHQQALTQQLPPAEQAQLRQQQDLMRQAFNSLLTQQLLKLEQTDSNASSCKAPAQLPAQPPAQAPSPGQGGVGGYWPTPHLSPSGLYSVMMPMQDGQPPALAPSLQGLASPKPCPTQDMHATPSRQPTAAQAVPHKQSPPSPRRSVEQEPRPAAHSPSKASPSSTLSNSYPTIVNALHGKYSPSTLDPRPQPPTTGVHHTEYTASAADLPNTSQDHAHTLLALSGQPQYGSSAVPQLSINSSPCKLDMTPNCSRDNQKPERPKRKRKRRQAAQVSSAAEMMPPYPPQAAPHTTPLLPQMSSPRPSREDTGPTEVAYAQFPEAGFRPEQPGEIAENARVRVEGLSTMTLNPMIAIQSRLLAEEEKEKPYEEEGVHATAPMEYSGSLFAGPSTAGQGTDPSLQEMGELGLGVGSPGQVFSESEVVYNNVALVETVVTEPEPELTPSAEVCVGDTDATCETGATNSSPLGLTTPGWFGKGWNAKKYKRRKKSK